MTGPEAVALARSLYLDDRHPYGCAETTLLVLKSAFGLPDPMDAGSAMAFNGGVANSGGVCGVISGAAIAVGLLAELRIADHSTAKRVAREVITGLMDDFRHQHGAVECRTLIGRDIRTAEEHRAFLESGLWRQTCMAQITFAVDRLAALPNDPVWGG